MWPYGEHRQHEQAQIHHFADGGHRKRLERAYRLAGFILVGIGLISLFFLSFEPNLPLVAVNFGYVVLGVLLLGRIDGPNLYKMAALTHAVLFVLIVTVCLVYDVPDHIAPRVSHLYLLSMAFLAYVTFWRANEWATYAVVLAYLGVFLALASTNYVASFAPHQPDEMRVAGAWLHAAFAVFLMCACVYIMQTDTAARSAIARQLASALASEQFEVHFQPQVDEGGHITGAEMLLRWRHPEKGLVPPAEFIPAAEQLGMMKPIGEWVLKVACRQLQVWKEDPCRAHLKLAVNVSAQQFHDARFVAQLEEMVTRHLVDPARLELELTETMLVDDLDGVIIKMRHLVDFGVSLSLDDFGTGYSSLQYLKRMPFHKVKIDRGFVRDMMTDERDAAIVRSIVQMGREMHMAVIAEGVETDEQRKALSQLGCQEFQGYLFGKPTPVGDFLQLTECGVQGRAAA
jgi:EAL domain-containing protein (putative c-di-GMP-specific phosphodiesterase class I)